VGAACVACCCLPAFARAAGRAQDAGSTSAYLRASYAFARAELRDTQAIAATIAAWAGRIDEECPSALTFVPRDRAFGEVAETIERSVSLAGVAPMRSAMLAFAAETAHLKWANPALTRLVRAQAQQERWAATVALPALCAEIAAWRGSAYTTLPAAVGSFLARAGAGEEAAGLSEESLQARIEDQLGRHETPSERRLANEIKRLEHAVERRLNAAEAVAQHKLEAGLGAPSL
jgi:hypothetical protein